MILSTAKLDDQSGIGTQRNSSASVVVHKRMATGHTHSRPHKGPCPMADPILEQALILTIHQLRPTSTPSPVALRSLHPTSLLGRSHGLSVPSLQDLCSGGPTRGQAMRRLHRTRLTLLRPLWGIRRVATLHRPIRCHTVRMRMVPVRAWSMAVDT